jgi:uncharacterized protein (DUF2344 family)
MNPKSPICLATHLPVQVYNDADVFDVHFITKEDKNEEQVTDPSVAALHV